MLNLLLIIAAVPLCWERTPNRPAPAQFDTFHGESIDFRCTFTGFGALPFAAGEDVRLWYQTNGMGAAWWSIPATVSNNVLAATFTPSADPGAERLTIFFGAPSNAYAAAQVRFRNSPGVTPNFLPPPSILDWQSSLAAATNALHKIFAPAITNAYTIATNALTRQEATSGFTDWEFTLSDPGIIISDCPRFEHGHWQISFTAGGPETATAEGTDVSTNLIFYENGYTITAGRTRLPTMGDFEGLISAGGATNITTNIVTKTYVESLGIKAGISAETATKIAEDAAATATAGLLSAETDPLWNAAKAEYAKTGTVAQVSEAVGTLWSYVYGDSVWIAVTNYMRTVGGVSPSFQLWEVREGVTNLVYWSKEEITNVTHDLIHDCKTNLEATVRNVVADMPDKAWSKYQSATGNEAPDGVTIVSTPTIQLTGGGEWYRYVDVASNSVWFLKSNGLHTFGGDTNGYFRILDDEGNATFEVRKTDSYLVDAVASSVHFDADGNFCVSFESNIEPVIYTTASLESPNFLPQGDDPNVTVTWTQSGGTYTATLEQAVKGPSLFAYAKVEVQGETVIRNTVPTDLQGGIIVNGVKYNVGTATINGNTVLTLTPRN